MDRRRWAPEPHRAATVTHRTLFQEFIDPMSHIPASRMPHAHAHEDQIDGQPPQAEQGQPDPAPTTAVPPAAASGVSEDANKPDHMTLGGSETSSGPNDAAAAPTNGPSARDADDRSTIAITALVIGGIAAIGGMVAVLLPLLAPKEEPKSKKRKKRKDG
jgi:hypothetical protein